MKLARARCRGGREQAGSCLPKRFHLLLCSRWLLGHFGQRDWKRAIICFLDGLPALVFGEFQVTRLSCPNRVILYAVLLCHSVLVCFGSDLLPKLLNTCELSVVTLSSISRTTDGGGKQDGLGSWSVTPQPHAKGHACHAVVMGEGTEGYCLPTSP